MQGTALSQALARMVSFASETPPSSVAVAFYPMLAFRRAASIGVLFR